MTLFLPLDIPPIPNRQELVARFTGNDHIAMYDENDKMILGKTDSEVIKKAKPKEVFCEWREETLLGGEEINQQDEEYYEWNDLAKTKYPELIKWIDDYFPLSRKFHVKLSQASGDVLPHTDSHENKDYMAVPENEIDYFKSNHFGIGYRFILNGSKDSLYFCREVDFKKDLSEQPKHFCEIPEETDAFALDSYFPHGVDVQPGIDDNRILALIVGKLDVIAHKQMLKNSKRRFGKYEVTEEGLTV